MALRRQWPWLIRCRVVQAGDGCIRLAPIADGHHSGFGKSLMQQRPDGLLVSHEHNLATVWATTKSLIAGLPRKSPLVTPKQ
jgi:hypothetical protein